MSALDLISRLRAAGIRLTVTDGKIRLKAEKGVLTDDLKQEIVAHKREIITLLGGDSSNELPLLPISRDEHSELPLSYAQQRLWFLDELEPGTPVYNMPFAIKTKGDLDVDALQAALDNLVKQHESLRTVFVATDKEPAQIIRDRMEIPVNIEDLSATDTASTVERCRELAKTSFDLANGPLLSLNVLRTGDQEHLILLVIHHIISDLWSMDVFSRDLGAWYEKQLADVAPSPSTLPVQYADYALWQRQLLSGDKLQGHLDYWLQQLDDAPAVLELPTDRPRPPEPSYRGQWRATQLTSDLRDQLQSLAQQSGCTMFMLTFAAFATLLHKYSGEDELVIGTPISGRQRSELEGLIGFFLNTLALRVAATDETRFSDLLAQIKQTALAAYAHQELPFEKLVEELQPDRDMSHTPIFQHMFIWQDSASPKLQMADLETESATLVSHDTAKFDLTLAMTNTPDGIEAGFEYNTDLFDGETIERMLEHLRSLLQCVAANPTLRLIDINLLNPQELRQLTTGFIDSTVDFGAAVCAHELVEKQAEATPDRIALVFGTTSLSYAELDRCANTLAAHLAELGAAPGTIVAISCERSPALAIAALATLKSGACYVPVDPGYPQERITAMLGDSGAKLMLSQAGVELPRLDAPVIDLDDFDFSVTREKPDSGVSPDDALYCIYTSGSTGKPKGVQLSHAGLTNLLRWQQRHDRLGSAAKTLQFASFSFDVSFQELFSTWSTGGTLVMVDQELRQDLPALAGYIAEENIERLYLPFAALQPIAETLVATRAQCGLRDIVVAGEPLLVTPEVRTLFTQLQDAALHNQYGPSETHVVTALTLTGDPADWPAQPSIGAPIANTGAYVLNSQQQPVPIGVPGELYLGGIQVALGYLHRPELNAEKFLPDPFKESGRLYRTGDQVRFLRDGQIEFLGRADDQIKWRGFRIEPGEIETALTQQPGVQQAIVMLRQDGNNPQLVGYITGDESLDIAALKDGLRRTLPDYMVPPTIIWLESLPLTPSGKIARRKLPVPEYARDDSTPYAAPRNPTEESLVAIWADVLGLDQAGINDDFFTLGGHSLLATQLVSRIRDQFNISLPLKFIFRYPTPAGLAETVATLQTTLQAGVAEDSEDREEFRI